MFPSRLCTQLAPLLFLGFVGAGLLLPRAATDGLGRKSLIYCSLLR